MEKNSALGISSHYEKLPHGEKNKFVMEIANAIGKSTDAVRRKIRLGIWNEKLELPVVNSIVAKYQ